MNLGKESILLRLKNKLRKGRNIWGGNICGEERNMLSCIGKHKNVSDLINLIFVNQVYITKF